jgi:hypothetical protein
VGPTASLDDSGEERIPCLLLQGFEPHTVKPEESRPTAYAISIKLHKYYTFHVTSSCINITLFMLHQRESHQVHQKSILALTKRKQFDYADITVCKIWQ